MLTSGILVAVGAVVGVVVAQTDSTSGDQVVNLVQFGVLGVFALLLLTGRIVPKATLDRALAERDKVEAQRDKATETFQNQVLPALIESNRWTTEVVDLLKELSRMRDARFRDRPE